LRIGYGLAAVDPSYIPLGTRLYIEGYGHAVAGDTGGSIRGNRIDLGFDSKSEADRFGTRTVVVHILD
jgi:3D (Asp-Asp-Asp) domain-containing protein